MMYYFRTPTLRELLEPDPSPCTRDRSVIELEPCPACGEWLPAGSKYYGECGACGRRLALPSSSATADRAGGDLRHHHSQEAV